MKTLFFNCNEFYVFNKFFVETDWQCNYSDLILFLEEIKIVKKACIMQANGIIVLMYVFINRAFFEQDLVDLLLHGIQDMYSCILVRILYIQHVHIVYESLLL